MFRLVLSLGLIANAGLFAAGVWRSVRLGKQSFHAFGDLGVSAAGLSEVWLWPIFLLLLAGLIVLLNRGAGKKTMGDHNEY
ncbi:hypothetical protein MNBD_ALPHA06-2078 [hydrothermal vent metagenome]|uniref:Uncharacterized protein n=1 Tax=hydrothermal vent metagenome TaxID=652676 RepID=A0A3B0S944_9ZZZZ